MLIERKNTGIETNGFLKHQQHGEFGLIFHIDLIDNFVRNKSLGFISGFLLKVFSFTHVYNFGGKHGSDH